MAANVSHFSTIRAPDVSGLFKGAGAALGYYYGPRADERQRKEETRNLLADPGSYRQAPPQDVGALDATADPVNAANKPEPNLSAANLRPEALAQLRGLDPNMAFGIERFAQKQRLEEEQMNVWERESKAKEFEMQAKWWGMLEKAGMAVRKAYDDRMAAGTSDDLQIPLRQGAASTEFLARADAQSVYNSYRDQLAEVAKGLGVPLPESFSTEEFRPGYIDRKSAA